ncbi:MAG: CobW family GTP-binding protein [Prosthecobacter sp.]
MRVTILCGFLGSGKTTLLRRMLREAPAQRRLGVLVNDVSDLEVDGDLVREAERLSEAEGTLVSLYAGSISGSRREAFREALARFAAREDVEHLIIETSGSTHPWPLIEDVLKHASLELHGFITLLDARALVADHGGGADLLRRLVQNEANGLRSAENLLVEQLQFASTIVLTKAERVPAADLVIVRKTLEILHPEARVLTASYGKAEVDWLDVGGFDLERAQKLSLGLPDTDLGESEAYDIGHTVVRDERPLHPRRFWTCFREHLGLGIHRSKGFIWLASRPREVLLWNQTGGSIEMELMAYWKAELVKNPDGKLLPQEIAKLREWLQGTHPVFGDRLNELTLIGTEHDRAIFLRHLQTCFCTDDEIRHWQAGGTFEDPWPKNLRQVR